MGMKRQMCGTFRDTHVTHHSSPQKKVFGKNLHFLHPVGKIPIKSGDFGCRIGCRMRGKGCRIASSLPSFHAFPLHFPWAFCHGHKENAYVLCKKTASGRGGSCTKRGCWEFWLLLNQPFPTRNHFDCSIFIFDVLFFIICNDDSSFTRQYLWQFLQSSYLTVFCCVRALNRIV